MAYVLGFDSSTQSCSATLVNCDTLAVVGDLSVNFGKDLPHYNAPAGFISDGQAGEVHSDPKMWLEALDLLCSKMVEAKWQLNQVVAISGSGQQHGSVYLGADFERVLESLSPSSSLVPQLEFVFTRETSPIWMDNSTEVECAEIAHAVGGNSRVCEKSGSIMIERFTGSQIRKFSKQRPECYEKTHFIHLVSSFFASIFSGKSAPIDTGDGAGMNLMNLVSQDWDSDLLNATAANLCKKLPPISSANTELGKVSRYFVDKYSFNPDAKVYPWSGDNPCSLVGMGASKPGNMVISLGTSYTLFAGMAEPYTDPNGFGHVFGNPMGGYMTLICFMNGSLAREKVRENKEVDWTNFGNDYLEKTLVGNEGKLMLPFYDPEITPTMSLETPKTNGWSLEEESAAVQIRACLEGQFLNMRKYSEFLGAKPAQILLTGGGSNSEQICQVAANVFGSKVVRTKSTASASLGAAIMAGVAAGAASIEAFESALCELDEAATVHPCEKSVSMYSELMLEFEKLLLQ